MATKEFKALPRSFYEPDADHVAQALLGHFLIRNTPQGPAGGAIVEAEAYLADDPACHSFRGETKRNKSMFGPPGFSYVYLIYGMHYCFNTVCGPPGHGEAVLVRAIEVQFGEAWMRLQRKVEALEQLTNGPARLCQALDIVRKHDGLDICEVDSPLFVAENPERRKFLRERGPVVVTTRIGISKAADDHLRFYLDNSPFVSKKLSRKASRENVPMVRNKK
jgi:DNA-3-methyladenine glycosylase